MQLQHPQLKENNRKAANRRPEMIRGAGPLDYTRMHPPPKKSTLACQALRNRCQSPGLA